MNKKGYTLSELIIAITVVGIIASITVPMIVYRINNQVNVGKLKSTISTVQQLAVNQMAVNGAKDLGLTDFSSTDKLFSDKNFMIVKKCDENNAKKDCWGQNSETSTYKNMSNVAFPNTNFAKPSVILKNGVVLSYSIISSDENSNIGNQGMFFIDVNGSDKPNIVGRDLFAFVITKIGEVKGKNGSSDNNTNNQNCKSATDENILYCLDSIIGNNWQITY